MKLTEAVRHAATPREAIILLAQAIDDLRAATPPDPWESWGDESPQPGPTPADVDVRLDELRTQLAETTDPEERLALEARLRLLTEDGAAGGSVVPEGRRVAVDVDGDSITVDLPAVTYERMLARRGFASTNRLWEYQDKPMDPNEFCSGYGFGGPRWLYYGDRDAVMAMPYHLRQQLIADIEQDSPGEAQEIARDILKATTEEQQDHALGLLGGDDA